MSREKYIHYIPRVETFSYVVAVEVRDANALERTYQMRITVPFTGRQRIAYVTVGGGHTHEVEVPDGIETDANWARSVGEQMAEDEDERKLNAY